MTVNESNFDPMEVAALLDVVAAELREPGGEPKSPGDLGTDLTMMVEVTRKWATDHRIPPACIPEAPGGDVTNARAADFLTDLANVIRYLGPHAASLETMAGVVAFLKLRQALAAVELGELDFALKQLLENMTVLEATVATTSGELSTANEGPVDERFAGIGCTIAYAQEILHQIIAALREVCNGVETWRLFEKSDDVPVSHTRPS